MNLIEFETKSERHLGRALYRQAAENGEATFILFEDQRYSFAETNDKVNALAAGLAAQGLTAGMRVALCIENCPELIFLALAVNKLGAVWVPINTDYKGDWLANAIDSSDPAILVLDSSAMEKYSQLHLSNSSPRVFFMASGRVVSHQHAEPFESLYVHGAPEPDMTDVCYSDTSAILWTSGTTGKSKGVMQSHNVWFYAVENANREFTVNSKDVIFNALPMYNSAAWVTAVFRALLTGLPLALEKTFSVSRFWQQVDHYGATQTVTLGAMHMFIWNAPVLPQDSHHSLRKWMAVPIPAEVSGPFGERFSLDVLAAGFGQSECLVLLNHSGPGTLKSPLGSCGKPVEGMDAKLVDEQGITVEQGDVGELWVRPQEPHILFSGYFGAKEATSAAFAGDWYKTGDLLRQDDNGFFYFSDRKKDAIRCKGRNISTFEVESVVGRHPAVAECAAFGVPSEDLASEDDLKVDVVVKPGEHLVEQDLAKFINENAPYFFVPRFIELKTKLPYTPTQKLQKYLLRAEGVTANTWDARYSDFEVIK